GLHAHVELALHVDTHAITGDQRLLAGTHHVQLQRVHVDPDDLVQHREYQRATVDDHLLSTEAGAHEADLLGRAPVQPRHHQQHEKQEAEHHRSDDDDAHGVEAIEEVHVVIPCVECRGSLLLVRKSWSGRFSWRAPGYRCGWRGTAHPGEQSAAPC